MGVGGWGGGDGGLGIGDWGLGPIPNPQSPIPNPQSPLYYENINFLKNIVKIKLLLNKVIFIFN